MVKNTRDDSRNVADTNTSNVGTENDNKAAIDANASSDNNAPADQKEKDAALQGSNLKDQNESLENDLSEAPGIEVINTPKTESKNVDVANPSQPTETTGVGVQAVVQDAGQVEAKSGVVADDDNGADNVKHNPADDVHGSLRDGRPGHPIGVSVSDNPDHPTDTSVESEERAERRHGRPDHDTQVSRDRGQVIGKGPVTR